MTFKDAPLDPGASAQNRLGWMLRILRESHGESQPVLADALGVSFQTISHWEHTGKIKLSACRDLDIRWNTAGWLERLWYEAREGQGPHQFGEFTRYERSATGLRIFGMGWVPGLLQTPEYARTAFTIYNVPDVGVELARRLERQETLTRATPPQVWITLDEAVLERPVGGPAVMREQMARLIELGEMRHIMLRLVPKDAGGYHGLDGAFHLMTTAGRTVAYVWAPGGGYLVQDGTQVETFINRWESIGVHALTWDHSKDLLIRALEGYS